MEKEFVSYKTALALKELGFDEPCFGYYDTVAVSYLTYPSAINKNSDIENSLSISKQDKNVRCSAPLYQQAFRWFREKHGLIGQPIPLSISYPGKVTHYGWSIVSNQNTNDWENEDDGFKTYEESESACLDKLIEIVKKK